MSRETKTPTLTRAEKLDRVYLAICRGLNRADVLAYASENHWSDKEAALDELIHAAEERLATAAANLDLEIENGKAIVRLNELYQAAFKCQDYKTALSIQKEINRRLERSLREPKTKAQPTAPRRAIRLVK
jgi:hypothetical protein